MFKIVLADLLMSEVRIITLPFIPRKGDGVTAFRHPFPVVEHVTINVDESLLKHSLTSLTISDELLKKITDALSDCVALVFVN